MRGILIVDVQNDFTEGGALATEGGAAVAAAITEHLANTRYALVVASRDWHDPDSTNGGHFAIGKPDYVSSWPRHCVADTPGAEYHSDLDFGMIDVHIRKGQGAPAYSAFEGVSDDGRSLERVLADHGINELDVVGIATDYCVLASALDARRLGLSVSVLASLTSAVAQDSRHAALETLREAGVLVREGDDRRSQH